MPTTICNACHGSPERHTCRDAPVTASAHPAPSTMAREAYAHLPTHLIEQRGGAEEARMHYAAGAAEERARVAAWLREQPVRVWSAVLAADLEGKVQS